MDAREPTLFGSGSTPAPAAPAKDDDSFFNFFPSAESAPARPAAASKPPPSFEPPAPRTAPSNETLFGSSLESKASASGETLFGDPAPSRPSAQSARSDFGGLAGLEAPGTLFGADPEPPPRQGRGKPPRSRADAFDPEPPRAPARQPDALSLSALEKDPLELEQEQNAGGFTQFGFKGAGDNRTLYGESQKVSAQRKLVIGLAVLGVAILALALGGLFVFMRTTAAPEVAGSPAPFGSDDDVESADAAVPEARPEPEPVPVAEPLTEQPHYPDLESGEPTAPPKPIAESPPPQPARPASIASQAPAPKGSPERLAQLMAMVETREWPASAAARIQAADELNDFGKIAEANVVYGRAMQASGATDRHKVTALGGMAATFHAMGMKPQALDALNQILSIQPGNSFAIRFREKLK
jgi:hypothetical protein